MQRVYQGGLHDVWCDGKIHQRTDGGYVCAPMEFEKAFKRGEKYPCDCAYWKRFNAIVPGMPQ